MTCIKCSKENTAEDMIPFHVLEVRTLWIRDMEGEKRVQALGKFQDYEVCSTCAKERLNKNRSFKDNILPGCLRFGGILTLGIILSILFKNSAMPLRFLGLAAMICGAIGTYEVIKNGKDHTRNFQNMSEKEALEAAAWEVLLDHAPKKSEDSDLTYIPVNKKTLAMKNGDLMNVYGLLPDIAVEAYKRIRRK